MAYFDFDNIKVFYDEKGSGESILLLAGNTASSKIFESILELYSKEFKIILIDFPGHGKSERLEKFETDFWFYNSTVCLALLEELKLDKVAIIGTSGGALVGINLALEHPERINYLIADSFMGEYPLREYNKTLREEREKSKKNKFTKEFWAFNHGFDWKKIVDLDTEMFIDFCRSGQSFFHKSIAELSVPTLLTGSKQDEFCSNFDEIYAGIVKKNKALEVHLFETGNHPSILSNADIFFNLVKEKIKPTQKIPFTV